MRTITAKKRQTWFDISIQETGNVYNAGEIALANNRSVTTHPQVNEQITIPDGLTISQKDLQYLRLNNIIPATAIGLRRQTPEDYELPNEFPISL